MLPMDEEHGEFPSRVKQCRTDAAVFRRADLHVHSWGSDDFEGEEGERCTQGFFDSARLAEKGIEVVGITDHNRCKVASELDEGAPDGVLVLPGMEISFRWHGVTDERVHLVLLCPSGTQWGAVEQLFHDVEWPPHDERGDGSVAAGPTVNALVGRITAQHGWLCIAAHANSDGGGRNEARQHDVRLVMLRRERRALAEREREGTASEEDPARLRELEQEATEAENELQNRWLELVADCGFSGVEIREGQERVFYEGAHCSNIGIDPIACVVSSDAHAPADIGRDGRFTYLKMGEVSFDGVRRALTDPGARIRFSGDATVGDYWRVLGIECVPLKEGAEEPFLSRETIGFSDDLTCLVGNRGAGKSTAVDALRFVFMHDVSGIDDERIRGDVGRRIARTLANSRTRVLVQGRDGNRFLLWRDCTCERPSNEELAGREWDEVIDGMDETIVRALDEGWEGGRRWGEWEGRDMFQVELFGWSEIEHIARSRAEQLGLVDIDVQDADRLKGAISDARNTLLINDAALGRVYEWVLENQPKLRPLVDRQRELAGLTSEAMEEVFEELDAVKEERQALSRAKSRLQEVEERVVEVMPPGDEGADARERSEGFLTWLSEGLKAIVARQVAAGDMRAGELEERIDRIELAYAELLEGVEDLSGFLGRMSEGYGDLEEECRGRIEDRAEEAFRDEIESGAMTAEEVRERVWRRDEIRNEVQELLVLERQVEEHRREFDRLMVKRREELRGELESAEQRLAAEREETINRATAVLGELGDSVEVLIGIERGGDIGDWAKRLKDAFQAAGVGNAMNYVRNRYAERIAGAMRPGEFVDHMLQEEPEHRDLALEEEGQLGALTADHARRLRDIPSPHAAEEAEEKLRRLSTLLELEQSQIGDLPQITLNGRAIGELSPGQRCSALLPVVLLRGDWPVIVDQPEDNLDSEMVFDVVVDVLRSLKQQRQVILATHDPNIPVSGDAEQIVVLRAASGDAGEVVCQASVDDPAIIKHVTNIMEGGEEAFRRRANKYSFRLERIR